MSNSDMYNGWKNYETWLVNLWLNSTQSSYGVLEELRAEPVDDYRKAERLKESIRELYEFEPRGMIADLVNAAFVRVDWIGIVQD